MADKELIEELEVKLDRAHRILHIAEDRYAKASETRDRANAEADEAAAWVRSLKESLRALDHLRFAVEATKEN